MGKNVLHNHYDVVHGHLRGLHAIYVGMLMNIDSLLGNKTNKYIELGSTLKFIE